jgi:BirA family transcriptional regulator, biotin operon repressor / biotin---[acetyl-CoA-carboxylase] ligase
MSRTEAGQSPDSAVAAVRVPLAIDALRVARRQARIGRQLHYYDTIGSTNDAAKALAVAGADDGTVVIAEQQTAGRGRLGRAWASPPFRNLYVSIVLRPPIAATAAPPISLVAGLAVAETVREWVGGALIKWPNDVVIDGRKVAGILTELESAEGHLQFVIVGIGVNLNSAAEDFPQELRDKAVAVCALTAAPVDRVRFTNHLLSRFEERYDAFLHHGFAALRPSWEQLSCLSGRCVQIDDGSQRFEGIVVGMADDGTLRLRDATQRERAVIAGDVTVVDGYSMHRQPSGQER